MNKKVLKTMIALVLVFLVLCYVLKIFMPEQFVLSIEIKVLIDIGNFIDVHDWLYYIFGITTSFITYWLYLSAVCRRWYLRWYECLTILMVIGTSIGFNFIDVNLCSALNYTSFIFLPLLFGARLKETGVAFTIHILSQFLSLSIRDLPIYFTDVNSVTLLIAGIDAYLWLALLYIYYNYKKEDNKQWDGDCHQSTEKTTSEKKRKSLRLMQKLRDLKKKKQSMSKESKREQRKKNLTKLRVNIRDFILDELWVYVIIIGSIALCSWIFNRWIEGFMFVVAHIVIRRVFDKQFHFDKTAFCLILTCAIIWFAIPISMPIATSLLSSLLIAFLVCFFGYLAQDRVDLLKARKGNGIFDFNHCTREQVIEICNDLDYSKDKTDMAIMFFVDKLKNKQVWEIMCNTQRNVEYDTIKQYKYLIKQDFKNAIKEKE